MCEGGREGGREKGGCRGLALPAQAAHSEAGSRIRRPSENSGMMEREFHGNGRWGAGGPGGRENEGERWIVATGRRYDSTLGYAKAATDQQNGRM